MHGFKDVRPYPETRLLSQSDDAVGLTVPAFGGTIAFIQELIFYPW